MIPDALSMADFKTLCHNKLLLDRFISVFEINTNTAKNGSITFCVGKNKITPLLAKTRKKVL